MSKVHYSHCPVCDSTEINPLLTVTDYSVSKESFVIWQCNACTLRFTQDVPDQESIGPYYQSPDYISHSNTNKGLLNQLYQRVRKFTLDQKASLIIGHTKPKGKMLDIGAGIGAFLNEMKGRGWEVTGVEPDSGARSQARSLFGLELLQTEVLQDLPRRSFDAITLWHVLEHVHALQDYMALLHDLLAPGGKIFIAVPNYTSVDAQIYGNAWAAYDVPRHLYHFTPASIAALVKRHGLVVKEQKPMWFDSFYISLLSSKYRHGKTGWIGAGLAGLRSNAAALMNHEKCSSLIYVVERA